MDPLLLVDINETATNPDVVASMKAMFPIMQTTTLEFGDFNVILGDGSILAIERKRIGDLLGSIADGRVFRQVEEMSNGAKWCCIIVEGLYDFNDEDMVIINSPLNEKEAAVLEKAYEVDSFINIATGTVRYREAYSQLGGLIAFHEVGLEPLTKMLWAGKSERTGKVYWWKEWELTNWRGASLRGTVNAITWSGCPIIQAERRQIPFAHMVYDLVQFCSRDDAHYQSLGRKRITTFPPIDLSTEIIAAFPGVGLKRAKSLQAFAAGRNDNGVAPLGESLSWASALHLLAPSDRPAGWGERTIQTFRATLGLMPYECLTIMEDKREEEKGTKNGK